MVNYNGKLFRSVKNSENAETSPDTLFRYVQEGNIVTSVYSSKKIKYGHLLGIVDEKGHIEMRYHQVNYKNQLMTGICISVPEELPNGKIRLYEDWQWTSGDNSKGNSILDEV